MKLLIDFIGIPTVFLGIADIWVKIDQGKSIIITILAASYVLLKMYWMDSERRQAKREKEIDLWHKEQDRIDRMNKNKTA